jgi:hypothetical protein
MTVARPAEDVHQAFGEGQPQRFTVDLFTDVRQKTRDTGVPSTANVRAVYQVPNSATTFGYSCSLSSASLARWGWRIGGASSTTTGVYSVQVHLRGELIGRYNAEAVAYL